MEIDAPKWESAKEVCPCECDGAELIFTACPSCGDVVLICGELGTVFHIEEKKRGSVIAEPLCRKCGRVAYEGFRSASSDEIQALGFQAGDYR